MTVTVISMIVKMFPFFLLLLSCFIILCLPLILTCFQPGYRKATSFLQRFSQTNACLVSCFSCDRDLIRRERRDGRKETKRVEHKLVFLLLFLVSFFLFSSFRWVLQETEKSESRDKKECKGNLEKRRKCNAGKVEVKENQEERRFTKTKEKKGRWEDESCSCYALLSFSL